MRGRTRRRRSRQSGPDPSVLFSVSPMPEQCQLRAAFHHLARHTDAVTDGVPVAVRQDEKLGLLSGYLYVVVPAPNPSDQGICRLLCPLSCYLDGVTVLPEHSVDASSANMNGVVLGRAWRTGASGDDHNKNQAWAGRCPEAVLPGICARHLLLH